MEFPIKVPALKVVQPIGVFYVVILPARVLLDVAYSHVMSAELNEDGKSYKVSGTQRPRSHNRGSQIADYIDRFDSTFPNSIILAANHKDEKNLNDTPDQDGLLVDDTDVEDDKNSWTIEEGSDGTFFLVIPSRDKLAAVIDGQHRLFAFADVNNLDRLDMQLICAVFLDLPKPFQAQIFATINSNQKPVDRSLTFELFGYNISEEDEKFWAPDKLAVFLTRKLATEDESALKGRIVVAPKRDSALLQISVDKGWKVSTATVVDGILRLISSNPKRDSNAMVKQKSLPRTTLINGPKDNSPLRRFYLDVNDKIIYVLILNYLGACNDVFWKNASPKSFIHKTVGVQALFDILRKICSEAYEAKDISKEYFIERFGDASSIDFEGDVFRNASGSGRSKIRKAIEEKMGI
ncbi:MAG: DNA phosphorothioation-associated DGQHR protein 1 [Moraxellaceae bacterium]|nr:DNA phosphorothioation-associated DGQHR protein 1 [Moraxellaceae bacterium]MDZ4386589.1 DNA phosphorothioation-associated DGQHR protein 1 [Moraxellaceae bacterium]